VSRFVLDNTVTMAWCFTDEATALTEALLGRLSNLTDSAIVPALWLYEVVNVTELAVRKGRITEEKARTFLESLAEFADRNRKPDPAANVCLRSGAGRRTQAHRLRRRLPRTGSPSQPADLRRPIERWRKPRWPRASIWSSYEHGGGVPSSEHVCPGNRLQLPFSGAPHPDRSAGDRDGGDGKSFYFLRTSSCTGRATELTAGS
jgi:hypothetical protein